MTDSSDYIGELEMTQISADERAAWADHFRAMGWAPPEDVEELREALRQLIQRSEDIISEKWNCGDPDVECPLQDATKDWHLQGDINRARSALDGIDAVTAKHTD